MPLSRENAELSRTLVTELEGYVKQLDTCINSASEDLFSLCATIFAIASFINALANKGEGTLVRPQPEKRTVVLSQAQRDFALQFAQRMESHTVELTEDLERAVNWDDHGMWRDLIFSIDLASGEIAFLSRSIDIQLNHQPGCTARISYANELGNECTRDQCVCNVKR